MIERFVKRFDAARETLKAKYLAEPPSSYDDIVKDVVGIVSDPEVDSDPDVDRIVKVDHGDYQGMLLFVIGGSGYQPHSYWVTDVSYGSCSGCDTLQRINDMTDRDEAAGDCVTLALHLVQSMKQVTGGGE
jgi:hypothetical protein